MATSFPLLATEIATAIGQSYVTTQVMGFAHGILEELTQNGTATFGFTPTGHTISGMTAASMAGKIATYAGYGYASPELVNFCMGIVTHIQGAAIVTYTGPIFPPPPPPGWFLGGTISGLSGPAMASLVQSYVGYPSVSPQLLAKCTAIANHIMTNASVVSGVIS